MFGSRRLWLFSPLVVLTLFFGALGWRNWHLSMDEEDVLAAVVADFRGSKQRPTDVINQATWRASSPFADEEVTVVSRKKGMTSRPVSAALMARLKWDYPKAHLIDASNGHNSPECTFSFEEVQIINRFQAKCVVHYTLRTPDNSSEDEFQAEDFTLKRSPINFRDTGWQIEEAEEPRIDYLVCY